MALVSFGGRAHADQGSRVEKLLDEWRFDEARAALDTLGRSGVSRPEIAYLEGYTSFLEGDYVSAVRSLEEAGGRAEGESDVKALLGFAEAARDAVKDHKEERSAHFTIRYPAEDEMIVGYAIDTLEAAYAAIHDDLGWQAERPIRVDFYRRPRDLAAVSSLTIAEINRTGTIALCKWARLMITTPRALTRGYPWLDTLNHEFVHYAVSSLTHDKAPVWLQEGLAKFLERRWRQAPGGALSPTLEHFLARALASGRLIGFEAMHPSMAKLPSDDAAALAFAEVAVAIEYLHAQGGMGALRQTLRRVADGGDARQAVASAAGVEWPAFEKGWRSFMAGKKYRILSGLDAAMARPRIRKEAAIASRRRPSEDEDLAAELKKDPAVRLVRLGNMLLRRDRARAAAVEYQKAAALDSASATIAVKLGRTHLALGEPDRALKAVAPARDLYPELPGPNLIAGQAHLQRGEIREAVAALAASLGTNPFDPEVHCALAAAYDKLPAGEGPPPGKRERERTLCRQLGE